MRAAPTSGPNTMPVPADRTLAEDLLLLLFQPGSGTIAGEGTLSYVLAGAVLAELGLGGHVRAGTGRMGSTTVSAVRDRPPADHLLRDSWDYVSDKPRGVQTVLPATGPTLRGPLLDRLVERGDLRRGTRRALGLFSVRVLEEGATGRRPALLTELRAVLVDGAAPTPRVAALAALLHASGTLPQLHPHLPWTGPVIARAEALKDGRWEAGAAAEAVSRSVMAYLVAVSAAASPHA
ncbi:Golgi phosphoprotein 3 (GPP34) [Georgenia satyanarayanai]|uniref:Golgi phosphoprotein 3 (GPP34) n=1 Tax=Georgenia satyanarayanai TaxID=860221 RepID=A0A2Y9BYX9_9MICO|nr:GPP34 family phosphoprotein [Georgenia satyanarayanai]PYF99244.1 Golgi phosphoprotein 3 GPP34 [Georgenia satyanarayanai]SSA43362.1 Golgi phosphoprotein 3 (GPP34) [Georgenia satyanarayanai]